MRSTFAAVLSLGLLTACAATLPAHVIEQHPRVSVEADRPTVVDSSGPLPRWVRAPERGPEELIMFVGQASATTLQGAEEAANADLSDAVARFIAVSVANETEATEKHTSGDGRVEESQNVRAETRSHIEASIGRVSSDASYWEKVAARTGPASYRYFLRANVKRSEIARARLAIACDRARRAGKKIIAVVQADPMIGDLETRLEAEPGWYVLTVAELAAASPEHTPSTVALTAKSLGPDMMLETRLESGREKLALDYAVLNGASGRVLATRGVSGAPGRLFELEDELWLSLHATLRSF